MATDRATMGTISQIQVGADFYNIVGGLFYGKVDSTSTSTTYTATIPKLKTTALYDGLTVVLKNGVVTSAANFTINVNGLGAKPCYNNLATGNDITPTAPTRDTTIFNINYTMMFIYNSTLVSGGAWICYRGYDASDTDHTHDAGDITSGTLSIARIPNLAASKITYGTMSQLRVQPIYYQAHGSGSINLTAGTVTKVTLVGGGALASGSGLAIASGGIKITTAGRYRITASAYVQNTTDTAALGRGVYVCKVASSGAFSATAEIFSAVDARAGGSAGAICCGPKIVECAANDIVYLAARSMNAAGICYQDNVSTYLLVERLS